MNFKSKLKLLPLALSLIVPAVASAQSSAAPYDYVIKVQVQPDNYLWIDVKGNFPITTGSCLTPSYARSAFPLSDERTKAWLQMALASFTNKKQVYVATNGCYRGIPAREYPIMTALQIQQ